MTFTPLGDRALVRPDKVEDVTAGGVYLPEAAAERPLRGTVVAVGDGRILESGERVAMPVDEGERVFYSKYGGTDITLDGEDLLILREADLLGVASE